MKMQVVTTITTLIDVDTFEPEHSVMITPEEGIPTELAKKAAIGAARSLITALEGEEWTMTSIPGTDLTTEAARNRATRMLNEQDAALMVALADAYDAQSDEISNLHAVMQHTEQATILVAIEHAKSIADRDKYSPQESAAAWDIVDALQTLRATGEKTTTDPDDDDRDGKQIARAEDWPDGSTEDWPDNA